MTYNWEEIFKSKSTKELYFIYIGKSFLPNETIAFARKELENRNFDFRDIEYYKKLWEIENIDEEIQYSEFNHSFRYFVPPWVMLFIAILCCGIIIYLTWNFDSKALNIFMLPSIIILILGTLLLNNYIYKRQLKHIKYLSETKTKLLENISEINHHSSNAEFLENLMLKQNERNIFYKKLAYIILGITSIWLILKWKH
jgi:hypothetical protein